MAASQHTAPNPPAGNPASSADTPMAELLRDPEYAAKWRAWRHIEMADLVDDIHLGLKVLGSLGSSELSLEPDQVAWVAERIARHVDCLEGWIEELRQADRASAGSEG